jgi:agmatine deiminase
MTYLMPAETAPHDRLWLAWPTGGYTLGDTAEDAAAARRAWAAVANTAAEFEPVTMVVDPSQVEVARRYLSRAVETLAVPLDDAWMRDIGPTWVHAEDGSVAAVDWVFNGWGEREWASWKHDQDVARVVAAAAGTPRIASPLVNEGGAIHVDGEGTVLLTESVHRGEGRNPHLSRAEIEAELTRTLGVTKAIWLPRGLTRDDEELGTRGHVDIVATFAAPGVLLVHDQPAEEHPDHAVMAALRDQLAAETDAAGRHFEIVDLPAPGVLSDAGGWVDYSYVNHAVVNGGVIACAFGDPVADRRAVEILAAAYPGREVVAVDAVELFARGGGVHCITQQQPAPRAE